MQDVVIQPSLLGQLAGQRVLFLAKFMFCVEKLCFAVSCFDPGF